MIKYVRKFLSKIFIAIVCVTLSLSAFGATNIPSGEIGEYGTWMTDTNREAFVDALAGQQGDLVEFQSDFQKQIVRDYVPVEARVGIAMMNGLNIVAKILDTTLVRFMVIFIIIMYAFWIMLEAYNMMTTDSDVKKLIKSIVNKTVWLIVWLAVLEIGPAQLFMFVVGPIITLGTMLSDFILNAITKTAGIVIPDTCGAIRDYAMATTPQDMIIDATAAADILCVPTRLSGFFVTAIATGFKWMIAGIGHSAFTFIIGAIFVVIFAWNTWKFALMAMSVIMNLFLGVLLLPFTALAETIPQTSYKGVMGNIFNAFLGLFKLGQVKLDTQINRFINAAIYFVSLSIVIAICAALLSGVITPTLSADVPTLENEGFIPTLLTGALVAWLAARADSLAKDIGGQIPNSDKDGPGKQFTEDIKKFIKNNYEAGKSWVKAYKESKK